MGNFNAPFGGGWGDVSMSFGAAPVVVLPSYPMAPLLYEYWPATALTLADLDPVDAWAGVNLGKVLDQATPTARPLFVAAADAVRFDGIDDYLFTTDVDIAKIPDSTANPTRKFSWFLVFSGTRLFNRYDGGWGSSVSATPFVTHYSESTANRLRFLSRGNSGGSTFNATQIAVAGPNIVLMTQSGLDFDVWINGVFISTHTIVNVAMTLDQFALGCLLRTTAANFQSADVHACGVATGAQSDAIKADPSALFAAAATEWGTPV